MKKTFKTIWEALILAQKLGEEYEGLFVYDAVRRDGQWCIRITDKAANEIGYVAD